jgi:hypothetical protein
VYTIDHIRKPVPVVLHSMPPLKQEYRDLDRMRAWKVYTLDCISIPVVSHSTAPLKEEKQGFRQDVGQESVPYTLDQIKIPVASRSMLYTKKCSLHFHYLAISELAIT